MQTALKVAWDNRVARRNEAGTGVYASCLLRQLTQIPDIDLEVLSGWSVGSAATIITRALRTSADVLWTHGYLPATLWSRGFDVLHAPAFVAPIVAPCPVVITIHDITYLLFPSHIPAWWRAYMKMVMPRAVKSAAAILCGSEHSKCDIATAYGINRDKVHVVPYGVEHERFHPGVALDRDWARRLGIRGGYLLHVGALSHRKNIPLLLRAIDRLRSKGKWANRQLVLAGSEMPGLPGADEIYATIKQLELSSSVILAGRVPVENLPGLYARASLLVMPSVYEGFGFPILEAMAAGTPVITSDSSSLPEVAGDAAILFPPQDHYALADAIEELLQNPMAAEELRRKGLARSLQFSWQRTAAETMAVYRAAAT